MLAVLRKHLENVGWLASIELACTKLPNKNKLSVLHVAAANGKTEIASVLLKSVSSTDKSSLISTPDDKSMTAFHWSCSEDHLEFSKWLLEEYKNYKSEFDPLLHTIRDFDGTTPLVLDVLRNHLKIVGWLSSIDLACMKLPNKDKLSVLHVAAANGKTEIASVLLKSVNSSGKSSLISSPDDDGRTAFHRSCFIGKSSLFSAPDDKSMTGFHWSCSEGHLEFSKWLLEEYKNYKSESDPLLHTIRDVDGITPLVLAVLRKHLEIVGGLASIDLACMKLPNIDKLSVLHKAAANGKTEIASVLLKLVCSSDKSSLISSPDDKSMTAFHWSCSECHLEFSKRLLEEYKNYKSESDPLLHTMQNNNGITPLVLAVLRNHLEIVG